MNLGIPLFLSKNPVVVNFVHYVLLDLDFWVVLVPLLEEFLLLELGQFKLLLLLAFGLIILFGVLVLGIVTFLLGIVSFYLFLVLLSKDFLGLLKISNPLLTTLILGSD